MNRYLLTLKGVPSTLCEAMRYSLFPGGKRIRPILAIESCKACGGKANDVLAAACAVELVHTYSLIHDDLPCMDDDDYRRGKPACHKAFGESTVILAGDAFLTLAFNVISGSASAKTGLAILLELSEASGAKGMLGGQVLDLELKEKKRSPALANRVNRLKTSRLFEASAKIGAIAALSSEKEERALAVFGADLGIVFQCIDDIMDNDGSITREDFAKCGRLTERAKGRLRLFGRKAATLKTIADYILNRKS